tara:strand:+ start:305 stop:523 length:219 start_codon:yes stop_codon:yes gene_type:complete
VNIVGAVKAIAEMPAALRDLTQELKGLGQQLNKAQAQERLASKRKRNAAVIRAVLDSRVSGSEARQREKADD